MHSALGANDPTLTSVDCMYGGITTQDIQNLIHSLRNNTILTNLNLHRNKIGPDSVSQALKENKALTNLSLMNNYISSDGARALAEALKINTTLISLDLRTNDLGPDGAQVLLESVQKNYATVEISTSNPELCQKLLELCSINKAYKEKTYKLLDKLKESGALTEQEGGFF